MAVSTGYARRFRLLMDGGPHHGRIIENEGTPLIWQFAVMPEVPICAYADGQVPFAPMETDSYMRDLPALGDHSLWFYNYLGRR